MKHVYDWYAKEGFLTARPFGGLTVYDYTSKTVMSGNWNHHTRGARGLVLDRDGRVVARPWPKFFSLNERPETRLDDLPDEPAELTEKMDGSFLIAFLNPETGAWQACTRAAWDNPPCAATNARLAALGERLDPACTYLFELVAPWNRIVVRYPHERLILLGVVHTETGEDWAPRRVRAWGLERGLDVLRVESRFLRDVALDDPDVVHREGWVARFDDGRRVKLKYARYLHLHRILEARAPNVPEAFARWMDPEDAARTHRARALEEQARDCFEAAPNLDGRAAYAAHFGRFEPPLPEILMRMLDGRPYEDLLWPSAGPRRARTCG
jgi:RNA ligase